VKFSSQLKYSGVQFVGSISLLDVDKIRLDFPILQSGMIYMDSATTSLTPQPVLAKIMDFYQEYRANVGRGVHRLSRKASDEYDLAHRKIAEFLNARNGEEVIMTRNTTEGINIIANGLRWRRGDKVVTTLIEHHSNFIVWQRLRQRHGVRLQIVRPNEQGLFDLGEFEEAIDDSTRLVTVPQVSNSLGVIVPVRDIARIAAGKGALTLIDGAQAAPHMKVDVREIGCDFFAFSGHKMCGPTGSGALYIKEELAEEVEPTFIGGGTILDVSADDYKLTGGWHRFEAGTPAIAEGIGLGGAVDYLSDIGMETIRDHEITLGKRLYERLTRIPRVSVYGPEDIKNRVGLASFNIDNMNPDAVASALDLSAKIMVRSGHQCALPTMKEIIHAGGAVRASLYIYNSVKEVELFLSTVEELARRSV
jgi:cysteine desulfurase/selenocysteine lyase